MRQRARMFFTFLAAVLLIIGAFMVIVPAGVSAASQAKLTNKQVSAHTPHYFFKPGNSHYQSQVIPAAGNNLNYGGGPVMTGTTNVYAIFWEPGGNVAANYNSLITRYFGDVGGSPLYQINNQYTQSGGGFPSNSHFAGSWVDSGAYTRTPLLDTSIQNEVTHAQQVNGWSSSNNNIFFVFTGRNQNICFDSAGTQCASNTFCAYHNFFGTNTIYAAMPYAASFSCNPGSSPNSNDADQTINVTSHEQMEAATDPLLNAWTDSSGNENGDKCAWQFGTLNGQGADVVWNNDPYIVQEEWDNNTSSCRLTPSTGPTPTPTPTNTPTPTPTGTPTPPPTPTPTPPPGGNLIKNGGFESGSASWTQSSTGGYQIVDPTRPHTGADSAYLCGYNNCRDTIYQTVSIPSNVTSASLTYYWYMDTTETSHSYDFMYVRVRNTGGSTLKTVQTISDGSSANGWHSASYDVTAYRGQTVQIAFVGTNDVSNPSDFFVDDVALNTH